MKKIRISAVSYLNTKPFIYGLFRSSLGARIDLSLDIPSVCAQKLRTGEADIALAPVAVIPDLPQAYLVSNYCIGAEGKVKTVAIFSERPIAEVRRLYLDFHSRTSVALAQILCREYWNIRPEFVPAHEGFEQKIGGATAGLVIGDRAIGLDRKFRFVYDLGEAWTNWTGLPFVFAAWISTRPLDPGFLIEFNDALTAGLERLPELTQILPQIPGFDMAEYFRHNIRYQLDDKKWESLNRFLNMLAGPKGFRLDRQEVALSVLR